MSTFNLSRVNQRMREKAGTQPIAKIHDYQLVSDKVARIVCSFSHDAGPEVNREALSTVLSGKATPVVASFRRINSKDETRSVNVGYITANRIAEELTEERAGVMTVVARNCLMDNTDHSLWQVHESASGTKFISRQEDEDLSAVLSTITQHKVGVPSLRTVASCDTAVTTYVAFIHPETATVHHGYVMSANGDKSTVIAHEDNDVLEISNDLIVAAYENVDTEDQFLGRQLARIEKSNLHDVDRLKKYYADVYNYSPDYLKEVDEVIDQQATV